VGLPPRHGKGQRATPPAGHAGGRCQPTRCCWPTRASPATS
jgi:hypothetical protein